MKWCCNAFLARYESRHERGLIIYVLPPVAGESTDPSFHIGFRALERSCHASFSEMVKGRMDICMFLNGSTGMSFCPWCGATLTKFYRSTWQELLDERITDEFKLPVT
jgi:hypothetical protein